MTGYANVFLSLLTIVKWRKSSIGYKVEKNFVKFTIFSYSQTGDHCPRAKLLSCRTKISLLCSPLPFGTSLAQQQDRRKGSVLCPRASGGSPDR